MHVGPRHHQLPHLHPVQLDRAQDEFFFLRSDEAAFARLLNLNLQFFGGVNLRVARAAGKSQPAEHPPAGPVEQTNRRTKHFEIPLKWRRNQQGDAFGALQAHAFGNEFAQHDVQSGEKKKRHGERYRVNQRDRVRSRNVCDQRAQDRGERRFPERAKSQAGERDSHLNAGNHAVQLADQIQNDLRPKSSLIDQLPHARMPHRNQ